MILNRQQQIIHDEAIQWFKYGSEKTFEISGKAGTGKSVLLAEIINTLGLINKGV